MAISSFIEFCDVTFSRSTGTTPPLPTLDKFTLGIAKGEFVAIRGDKWCGKSTLAKLLNGQLFPTKGDIFVNGMNTRDETIRWELRRIVGILFQDLDNQIVGTTVAEDVAFGPENLGLTSKTIRTRVDDALQMVGMVDYSGSAPHILSGIQKLKVSLAGVLAMQPACIVIDESTSGLDHSGRREIMQLLRRLSRESGLTVVLFTQLPEELNLTDRVVKLQAGRIIYDGAAEKPVFLC